MRVSLTLRAVLTILVGAWLGYPLKPNHPFEAGIGVMLGAVFAALMFGFVSFPDNESESWWARALGVGSVPVAMLCVWLTVYYLGNVWLGLMLGWVIRGWSCPPPRTPRWVFGHPRERGLAHTPSDMGWALTREASLGRFVVSLSTR